MLTIFLNGHTSVFNPQHYSGNLLKLVLKKRFIYLNEGMDNFFFIIQDKDYIDVKYVVTEMYFLTNFKRNSREGCPTSMKTKPREKMAFYLFKF